eukprot:GHRR01004972.1.p1 GENE.GHRR01004972.1~~GHRR01004972.1.p1  ORF type:complete len:737 (+),score=307.37 GHRR01004972.1:227-2212(+)
MASVAAALRLLAQASHVGKVVVSAAPSGIFPAGSAGSGFSKARVAITGGSGGLGLLMAQWLAASGAVRDIHLFSRQGRLAPSAMQALPTLLTSGTGTIGSGVAQSSLGQWLLTSAATLTFCAVDISSKADMHMAMHGQCGSSSAEGYDMVLHAAGVLQDGLLSSQTQASIRHVMTPKLGSAGGSGVGSITAATAAMPLQQLLLFSSVASLVGGAGQANYVAANAVLDGWAESGRHRGCAVTSVQWGAWASAGMASANVKERLMRIGQGVLEASTGLAALASIFRGTAGLIGTATVRPCMTLPGFLGAAGAGVVTVNPFDWKKYLGKFQAVPHMYQEMVTLSGLSKPNPEAVATAAQTTEPAGGMTHGQVATEVETALLEVLGRSLPPDEPFMAGGLDSLGAVEYVNLVGRRLNLQLPSTLVFDYPTTSAVTEYLAKRLATIPPPVTRQQTAGRAPKQPHQPLPAPSKVLPVDIQALKRTVYIQSTLLWPLATPIGYNNSCSADSGSTASNGFTGVLPERDCIIQIPASRWNADNAATDGPDLATSISGTRFGAFLQGAQQFDAVAFGLSASESLTMDPQHRLLLAAAAQLLSTPGAFANGVALGGSSGSTVVEAAASGLLQDTGVFVGISWTEYLQLSKMFGQPVGANTAQSAVLSVASGR